MLAGNMKTYDVWYSNDNRTFVLHKKGFKNLDNLPYHLSQLDDRRMESVEYEEFERADMIKRIISKKEVQI
jgi:hypothetical protein